MALKGPIKNERDSMKKFLVAILYSGIMFAMDDCVKLPWYAVKDYGAIPQELNERVRPWLQKNKAFVTELTEMPHPLTLESQAAKKKRIKRAIEENKEVAQLSPHNYIMKPTDPDDRFVVQIVQWPRLLAHLLYVTEQGDTTKGEIDPATIDWSKMEAVPCSYMTIGRVATYHRLKKAANLGKIRELRPIPTYIAPIPGRPDSITDENYVAIQEFVPDLVALKDLPEQEQIETINGLTPDLLQELYNAIKAAGTWDACANLCVDKHGQRYLTDYETTIFHHPDDFFFENDRGYLRYLFDTADGIERARMLFEKRSPNALAHWQRIAENDREFVDDVKKNGVIPSIVLELRSQENKK